MSEQYHDIPVDSEGVPILTDIVPEDVLLAAETATDEPVAGLSTSEIADDLLNSELFQQQLDEVAAELTRSIRLQVEQTLGIAIENVINKALDDSETKALFHKSGGTESYITTREEMADIIRRNSEKYERLIKSLNLSVDK